MENNYQGENNAIYSGKEALFDAEEGLRNYNRHIAKKFVRVIQDRISVTKGGKFADFGAGTGQITKTVETLLDIKVDCIEIDPSLRKILKEKDLYCCPRLPGKPHYEVIFTSNVLEHIENDSLILFELYNSIVVGGVLLVYVPAHQFLFSELDSQVGHYRRYSRKDLLEKIRAAGFNVVHHSYVDFLGVPASLCLKILGYRRGMNLGGRRSLKFYDSVIFPLSALFDLLGTRFLTGKNLFLVAEKKVIRT